MSDDNGTLFGGGGGDGGDKIHPIDINEEANRFRRIAAWHFDVRGNPALVRLGDDLIANGPKWRRRVSHGNPLARLEPLARRGLCERERVAVFADEHVAKSL